MLQKSISKTWKKIQKYPDDSEDRVFYDLSGYESFHAYFRAVKTKHTTHIALLIIATLGVAAIETSIKTLWYNNYIMSKAQLPDLSKICDEVFGPILTQDTVSYKADKKDGRSQLTTYFKAVILYVIYRMHLDAPGGLRFLHIAPEKIEEFFTEANLRRIKGTQDAPAEFLTSKESSKVLEERYPLERFMWYTLLVSSLAVPQKVPVLLAVSWILGYKHGDICSGRGGWKALLYNSSYNWVTGTDIESRTTGKRGSGTVVSCGSTKMARTGDKEVVHPSQEEFGGGVGDEKKVESKERPITTAVSPAVSPQPPTSMLEHEPNEEIFDSFLNLLSETIVEHAAPAAMLQQAESVMADRSHLGLNQHSDLDAGDF